MSRTTDYILEQEDAGKLYFDGTQYRKVHPSGIHEELEQAEYELMSAYNHYEELKNKIKYDK
jgi:hypothetical protein